MTVGDNIRSYRIANGMLQEHLAKAMGVSKQTVSSWETNRTEPNIGNIETLARIFGCSKLDLIGPDYIASLQQDYEKTRQENVIIEAFRKSDETTKNIILRLLDCEEK